MWCEDQLVLVPAAIGKLIGHLDRVAGLEVTGGTDFEYLAKVIDRIKDKRLSEELSPDFFEFTAKNGFWLMLRSRKGKCVSLQGARLEELGSDTLAQYWNKKQRRIYQLPSGGARLGEGHAHASTEIRGKVAYHGDMWLRKKYRGKGIASAFVRLALLVSLNHWDVDHVYGLMSDRGVRRGFDLECGFFRRQPQGTHWVEEPKHIRGDDWLVWSSRLDLCQMCRVGAVY